MAVYVGKNVSITLQVPRKESITDKLMELYHYAGVSNPSSTHIGYEQTSTGELDPTDANWTEFDDAKYDNVEKSDDSRHSLSTSVANEYPLMLFSFKCGFIEADVKKIVLSFEGYGTAPAGNGVTIKVWDHVAAAWSNPASGTAGADETLTITLTADLGNYIDDSGYIHLLARTSNPSDGTTAAVLYCDYVKCFVTKAKFTVDRTPISDRDQDGVANEPAHVTVKKNGVEVTVSSVNDSTGEVVLASGDFNETDRLQVEYRYDLAPYVAQEITLEPRQVIEGIDGLGSDIIQIWAPLLKEISGSIKEVFKPGSLEQIERYMHKDVSLLYDQPILGWDLQNDCSFFNAYTIVKDGYVTGEGGDWNDWNFRISDMKVSHPKQASFIVRYKLLHNAGGDFRFWFRWDDAPPYNAHLVLFNGQRTLKIQRVEEDVYTELASMTEAVPSGTWVDMEVKYRYLPGSGHYWIDVRLDYDGTTKRLLALDTEPPSEDNFDDQDGVNTYAGASYQLGKIDYWIETGPAEYGMIVEWDSGGQKVRVALDKVVFPEISIPSPKDAPVYLTMPFKAQTVKVIT